MTEFNYDQWDSQFDSEALKNDVKSVEANSKGEYKEVPEGDYEVKITKLELTQSKAGNPMVSCWFKVLTNEYKGSTIFMNQVLTNAFGIHKANEFLRSLTDTDVSFESFKQYSILLADIFEAIDGSFEYQLEYGKDAKGYNTYNIVNKFNI